MCLVHFPTWENGNSICWDHFLKYNLNFPTWGNQDCTWESPNFMSGNRCLLVFQFFHKFHHGWAKIRKQRIFFIFQYDFSK